MRTLCTLAVLVGWWSGAQVFAALYVLGWVLTWVANWLERDNA